MARVIARVFVVAAAATFGGNRALAAAETAKVVISSPVTPAVEIVDGHLKLDFENLASFPVAPPAFDPRISLNEQRQRVEKQIPDRVKAWHDRKAVVTGYMVPMSVESGLVTKLLLMRNTFAAGNVNDPWINEWVIVDIKPGVPARTLLTVSFFGVFKVGAIFEKGYLVGIYQLEAERMVETPGR